MLARLWTTRISPGAGPAYDAFANSRSRPMFAALPGCLGAVFFGTGDTRSVLSLWSDQASIDALERNPLYTRTVQSFLATGALAEPQTTLVHQVTGGTLDLIGLARTVLGPSGNPEPGERP